MKQKILIYRDYGCAPVDALERELRNFFVPRGIKVDFTDAAAIAGGKALGKDVLALWMPGGAAGAYRAKLGNTGEEAICRFVENGGVYAGICAGAYYACRDIGFEEHIPELKITAKGLKLGDDKAVGTLGKKLKLRPFAINEASAAVVGLEWADGRQFKVHYFGGPAFQEEDKAAEVLARYDISGKPAALLRKSYGKGMVLLCGAHYEDDYRDIEHGLHKQRLDYKQARKNADVLKEYHTSRSKLAEKIFKIVEEFFKA